MILTVEPTRGTIETLSVTTALDGVYRVDAGRRTLGYVLETGSLFVALSGAVYNTSVEIAQEHDLESAVRDLATR